MTTTKKTSLQILNRSTEKVEKKKTKYNEKSKKNLQARSDEYLEGIRAKKDHLESTLEHDPNTPDTELNEARIKELSKCCSSFKHFLLRWVWIEDETSGRIFRMNPYKYQKDLAEEFDVSRLIVILKARQLGVSWILAAYSVWRCIFKQNQKVMLLSKGRLYAESLKDKVKFIHDHAPKWMQTVIGVENTTTYEMPGLNNGVMSLAANPEAGRGFTGSVVILDEAAFHPDGFAAYRALKPTIDAGGQLIIVSTANGLNWFKEIWDAAIDGRSNFTAIFLPWSARSERTIEWYRMVSKDMERWEIHQEYPTDPVSAFKQTGRLVFDPDVIDVYAAKAKDTPKLEGDITGIRRYKEPVEGHAYVAWVDASEGGQKGDPQACQIEDYDTGEIVCTIHGRWPYEEFSRLVDRVCREYNEALLAVERQYGQPVIMALQRGADPAFPDRPYDNLFIDKKFKKSNARAEEEDDDDMKFGVFMSAPIKKTIIDMLERALRRMEINVFDVPTISELRIFKHLEGGKMGAGKGKGKFDDLVMSLAGVNYICSLVTREDILINASAEMDTVPISEWLSDEELDHPLITERGFKSYQDKMKDKNAARSRERERETEKPKPKTKLPEAFAAVKNNLTV